MKLTTEVMLRMCGALPPLYRNLHGAVLRHGDNLPIIVPLLLLLLLLLLLVVVVVVNLTRLPASQSPIIGWLINTE
jgi:hypothetical protein